MHNKIDAVDAVLSRFYGRPVVGGFTYAGWPVIRPVEDLIAVVDGGLGRTVPPIVMDLLKARAHMLGLVDELNAEISAEEALIAETKK